MPRAIRRFVYTPLMWWAHEAETQPLADRTAWEHARVQTAQAARSDPRFNLVFSNLVAAVFAGAVIVVMDSRSTIWSAVFGVVAALLAYAVAAPLIWGLVVALRSPHARLAAVRDARAVDARQAEQREEALRAEIEKLSASNEELRASLDGIRSRADGRGAVLHGARQVLQWLMQTHPEVTGEPERLPIWEQDAVQSIAAHFTTQDAIDFIDPPSNDHERLAALMRRTQPTRGDSGDQL